MATAEGVKDGPFVEAKEIVGGFMIINAESIEDAVKIASECPGVISGSYMWAAVYSDLHYRCGNIESACRYRSIAIETAPSDAIRELIKRRLQFSY